MFGDLIKNALGFIFSNIGGKKKEERPMRQPMQHEAFTVPEIQDQPPPLPAAPQQAPMKWGQPGQHMQNAIQEALRKQRGGV